MWCMPHCERCLTKKLREIKPQIFYFFCWCLFDWQEKNLPRKENLRFLFFLLFLKNLQMTRMLLAKYVHKSFSWWPYYFSQWEETIIPTVVSIYSVFLSTSHCFSWSLYWNSKEMTLNLPRFKLYINRFIYSLLWFASFTQHYVSRFFHVDKCCLWVILLHCYIVFYCMTSNIQLSIL